MRDANDKPLSSFGGSSRDWGEGSVTFEVAEDDGQDGDAGGPLSSAWGSGRPRCSESIASPAFDKENGGMGSPYDYDASRSPQRGGVTEYPPETDVSLGARPAGSSRALASTWRCPSPRSPRSLRRTFRTPLRRRWTGRAECATLGLAEAGGRRTPARVKFQDQSNRRSKERTPLRGSVRRSTVLSQSTDGNIFSASKDKALRVPGHEVEHQQRSGGHAAARAASHPKGIMDRIATLGPELPTIQKWILYTGIVLTSSASSPSFTS